MLCRGIHGSKLYTGLHQYNVKLQSSKDKIGILPDRHGELSRSAFTLSDQKSSTLSVSESTFCHTSRYSTRKPAGGKRKERRSVML